ncbi:MAG: cyclic nucleotide-binding domain-containing protein [Desulfocapsaceae bacterium]|nr:cyclic nucleotide-binding domain-containing protein [Desulfocapsaceae bacterium]
MTSIERQQHALEVLKCINKAITNLRLYPEQSAQVINAVEKAYTELKIFLRLYQNLRFGLHKGVPTLNGTIFEKKEREQLDALALVDALGKAGLQMMTLTPGMDRRRLKQVLSFFTANPEQIYKAGGGVAFVKNAGLQAIFLEEDGGSEGPHQVVVHNFADLLQQIVDSGVRRDDISLFLLPREGKSPQNNKLQRDLSKGDKGAALFAATVCFVLQPLQRERVYGISPDFSQLLENVSAVLNDDEFRVAAGRAATLLIGNLDKQSLGLLFCQIFVTRFGVELFARLVAAIDKESFSALVDFLRQEKERLADFLSPENEEQRLLVEEACQHLLETVKGRQLYAVEIMGMTEKQRQSKRLQAGLGALARGNLDGLRNNEVLLHLPATFERLVINKKESIAAAIIQTLVGGLKLDDAELRLRSGQSLGLIGEKLVSLDYWEWLEKLTPTLLRWLKGLEDADDSCRRFVVILQEIMTHAQTAGHEELVDRILSLFYAIRSGELRKTVEMRTVVGQVQDKAVQRNVLESYLNRCFKKPIEEKYCQKIVMYGPIGIQFLLDALLMNNRRPERIRLLKLLVSVGGKLPSLLLDRLREPMPWYGKRNLLRLLGETGDERDVSAVQGYLAHDDLRVQSEALSCIYKLSDQKKKQYLLNALPLISEKLKFQVVQALASVVDEEVVEVLVDLLKDEKYFSVDIKTMLLVSICEALGRSGSVQAQKALQLFSGKGVRPKNMVEEVWQAAMRGLALLDVTRRQQKERHVELQKTAKNAVRQAQSGQDRSEKGYVPVTNLAEEQEVYVLLGQNKKAAAKALLLDLISAMTSLRQFDQAEILCQRLAEIDPLALEDILKAKELLEKQKSAAIDQAQTINWVELYDFFTTEEFNAFYSSLEHVTYAANENIVVQGDSQQRLFFVNKGRVKLFSRDLHGNDILLKIVGPGEVFGVDSFFKASVWTVEVASVGMVDVFVLTQEALRKLQNTFPGLEAKLQEFCQQFVENESLKVMAIDRRVMERLNCAGKLAMAVLDDQGKVTGIALQGDIGDISIGGIFFTIRISQKRHVRLLLGRKVLVSLLGGPPNSPLTSGVAGVVVAIYVQDSTSGDLASYLQYAVHIQFDKPMQDIDLAAVVSRG